MYCRAVRQGVVEFGDERGIFSVLYCSGAKAGREAIQNSAGSCEDLDCTKVSLRRNISTLAALFHRKFRYDSRGPGQVVWARETGK